MSKIQPIDEVMCWAVMGKDGTVYMRRLNTLKRDAIADFVEGTSETWDYWRNKYFFRCIKVRVQITPIDNDLNDKKI